MTLTSWLQLLELCFLLTAVCCSFYTALVLQAAERGQISTQRLARAMFVLAFSFLIMGVGHLHMQWLHLTGINLFHRYLGVLWGDRLWLLALMLTWLLMCVALVLILRMSLQLKVRQSTARLVEANQQLVVAACQDPLTGVGNRRYFQAQAEQALLQLRHRQQPVSVLMLDLDHFKQVNDKHGHAAGDQVLIAFCKVLTDSLRKDDILARIGGEEFVALLPGANEAEARDVSERILKATRHCAVRCDACNIQFTASIGVVALKETQQHTVAELCDAADQVMYRVKAAGRDGYQLVDSLDGLLSRCTG